MPIYQKVIILFSFKFDLLDGNCSFAKVLCECDFNFAHKLNSHLCMENIYMS